jgi:hypothetical protein
MAVIYLYGFTESGTALPERGLLGVGDAEVELIELGEPEGVAAAIGRIGSPEFGGDALEARTADVEWMAEQGLRHEQVVAWFVDHAGILPSRLLTLFSSEDALRASASREAEGIRDRLDRFAALDEWDLKVSYDATGLIEHIGEVSEEVAELDRALAAATPGKRFLLQKKRRDLARTESRTAARRLARELLDTLRPLAEEVRAVDPPSDDVPVVLNAALLVHRQRRSELTAASEEAATRLERLGLHPSLTGPWAPYRFMDPDE